MWRATLKLIYELMATLGLKVVSFRLDVHVTAQDDWITECRLLVKQVADLIATCRLALKTAAG